MASSSNDHPHPRSTQFMLSHQQQHHHHQQNQRFQNTHHLHHQHHHQQNNQISFAHMMQPSSSTNIPHNYLARDNNIGGVEIDMDPGYFFLNHQDQAPTTQQAPSRLVQQENIQNNGDMIPPTLVMFPPGPMHVDTPQSTQATDGVGSPSTTSTGKRPSEPSMEIEPSNPPNNALPSGSIPSRIPKREGGGLLPPRRGITSSSEHDGPKTPDPKTLRRLAQNREAARKSRLRKKAYVQQLESSRIRLTQLEQELQRARSQGLFIGGNGILGGDQGLALANISPEAQVFDMEYARWVEEHNRLMLELRTALQEHISENDLRIYVENCLAHYDQVLSLKGMLAKTDVFHLFSGMWKTPAERCFLWIGGFRPSELFKIIMNHVQPLSEQQLMNMCGLQQSTTESEDALNHGLENLNQNVSETIAADSLSNPVNMTNYTNQMVLALSKLTSVEALVRQADHLRRTTLHRLHQILTTRQTAKCMLAIFEYFHRLRALSSLWLARPRQD